MLYFLEIVFDLYHFQQVTLATGFGNLKACMFQVSTIFFFLDHSSTHCSSNSLFPLPIFKILPALGCNPNLIAEILLLIAG